MTEFNIVTVLLSLNTLGWGIAWGLFRSQFNAIDIKVTRLMEKYDVLNDRMIKTETILNYVLDDMKDK
jgi:hypothetical protein